MSKKSDIQQTVTNQIIKSLESNSYLPWQCPWKHAGFSGLPFNFATKESYSGINILLLWFEAHEKGYTQNAWLTFNQANALGGRIIANEKSTRCIFFKPLEVDDSESGETKVIPMLKPFNVFNIEQIEGIEREVVTPGYDDMLSDDIFEYFQLLGTKFAENAGVSLKHGGFEAFYQPSADKVVMPDLELFMSANGYASTLIHELAHSTGHKSRLDRFDKQNNLFNKKEAYAFEELVAELTSAFVCGEMGLTGEHLQHESYIASWLKALKNDKTFIFKAAAAASKAHKYINEKSKDLIEQVA